MLQGMGTQGHGQQDVDQSQAVHQEAYQHHLNAMGNTIGQHGYMQNAFAILKESKNDDNVAMVMTQMANLTMQSQLVTASLVAMSSSVTLAINQLAANQQAMMQQMMAYANTSWNPPSATTVPITQFTIPFAMGGTTHGGRWGERRQGRRAAGSGLGGQHNPHTPFADYVACTGLGGGGLVQPLVPPAGGNFVAARNAAPPYSNIVKRYVNMNVCFLCGFDVEDGHISRTCPPAWRRANHQEAYNCSNAQH
jgi:hypothetical protein